MTAWAPERAVHVHHALHGTYQAYGDGHESGVPDVAGEPDDSVPPPTRTGSTGSGNTKP